MYLYILSILILCIVYNIYYFIVCVHKYRHKITPRSHPSKIRRSIIEAQSFRGEKKSCQQNWQLALTQGMSQMLENTHFNQKPSTSGVLRQYAKQLAQLPVVLYFYHGTQKVPTTIPAPTTASIERTTNDNNDNNNNNNNKKKNNNNNSSSSSNSNNSNNSNNNNNKIHINRSINTSNVTSW